MSRYRVETQSFVESTNARMRRRSRLAVIHAPHGVGAKAADLVASIFGSWGWIAAYITITLVWCIANVLPLPFGWDRYPFIFYTFSVSVLAILMSSVILLSQNRQAQRDRKRDDVEAGEVDSLLRLNEQQLEVLSRQDEVLAQIQDLSTKIHEHVEKG